jgi:hypothetical protein
MNTLRRVGILSLLVTTIFLFACSGGGGGGGSSSSGTGTGTLSVSLTDSSCSDYKAIYITIDEVQVKKNDDSSNENSGWLIVATPEKTYNLYDLVNGVTEVLGIEELEAGIYQQVRLIIGKIADQENNINGDPHPSANYILFKDGTSENLKIPSGFQTGVKLVHNFEVVEGRFVELLLDFEACKSVVETGNGKYKLKPTIKVIGTLNKTEVYGKVTDLNSGDGITLASVSAQTSDGISPSVKHSTLTSNNFEEEGEYSLLLLPDETYNIVVYSDDQIDDNGEQKLYSPACERIYVAEQDIKQDFSLELSSIGEITGTVTVDDIDASNPPYVNLSFYSSLPCGYVEVTFDKFQTDSSGNYSYSINLPYGTYDVVVSSEGYSPESMTGKALNASQTSITADFILSK